MLAFNRKRRQEFIEAQKGLEADSLEAARLAYMTNKATEEQIQMVEEANAHEATTGKSAIFKIPDVLGAPRPLNRDPSATEAAAWPGSALADEQQADEQKQGGIRGWLFSSLKKEDERKDSSKAHNAVAQGSLRVIS